MQLIEQMLMVFVVLSLLAGLVWVLRGKGAIRLGALDRMRQPRDRQLEVIERLSLTAHHSLHLVRVANRVILVGLSPSGCSLLESSSQGGLDAQSIAGPIGRPSR